MLKGLYALARPARQAWVRLRTPATLGVRILARDAAGRILLVRHTYISGLHLPGGGVDHREAPAAAAARELTEETGHGVDGPVTLFAAYTNFREFDGNYVLLYVASTTGEAGLIGTPAEIAEVVWCDADALPADVTEATRRRIREFVTGAPPAPAW